MPTKLTSLGINRLNVKNAFLNFRRNFHLVIYGVITTAAYHNGAYFFLYKE